MKQKRLTNNPWPIWKTIRHGNLSLSRERGVESRKQNTDFRCAGFIVGGLLGRVRGCDVALNELRNVCNDPDCRRKRINAFDMHENARA
jgi:hypothetical protein